MFKRIIIGILSAVMAATLLCGCTFISHNTERDYRQVAAYIEAYDIENVVRVPDGSADDESETTVKKTYRTAAKTIYKRDLVEYVNNNYSTLSQSYSDAASLIKHAMEMLVDTELIINEVDALIDAGAIKWGLTQTNSVKKQIYSAIDSSLISIKNEILERRDQPTISTDSGSVDTDTTYPVKPEETDDDYEREDTEVWEPSISVYPGLSGDSDARSLDREAMRRFIGLLEDRVADDFRVTAEDREKFDEDIENINNVIDTRGIEYVYPMIGQTHLIYYITGKNIERSVKIGSLQSYLTDSVTVSTDEVVSSYNALLNEQRSLYTADVSAYDTAMSGSDTVLYHPNNNYFYVKHILLPFSDAQKNSLTEYKERANVTEDDIKAFRARLADNIVCYPHVAGEDDKSRPMTVDAVMNEIKATMKPLESNVKRADVAFDDLIYLYNTDPGAFGNNKGYVVKYKLNDGESETYMQEFADAARYMRDNLEVGSVYYEKVITDYGVHIMYLASATPTGEVSLYDYTTPGELETYYDLLAEPIRTSRESAAYNTWEAEKLRYNYNRHATVYEKRYSDLWED